MPEILQKEVMCNKKFKEGLFKMKKVAAEVILL